jgi:hypothetical protein
MAKVRIVIKAYRPSGGDPVSYEFIWEGNEKAGRASMEHFEKFALERGDPPAKFARGILYQLPELLDRHVDLPLNLKAAILWEALHMMGPKTNPHFLDPDENFVVEIVSHHHGDGRGKVSKSISPPPVGYELARDE